jgi:hydrogenase maturation protease
VTDRRVLVAGIGNLFLSDDGFGVAVVQRLAHESFPPGVVVADYGIRGIHLAYDLLDGYDVLVLVDAVPMNEPSMNEPPGTLAIIEAEPSIVVADPDGDAPGLDAHSMSPTVVLAQLARLGGSVARVLIVGCQPASLDEGIGLSAAVAAAVDPAAKMVVELISDVCARAEMESPA